MNIGDEVWFLCLNDEFYGPLDMRDLQIRCEQIVNIEDGWIFLTNYECLTPSQAYSSLDELIMSLLDHFDYYSAISDKVKSVCDFLISQNKKMNALNDEFLGKK